MKIGIDCTEIKPNFFGGINSFTFGLLKGISSIETKHRFNIYVTKENRQLIEKYCLSDNFTIYEIKDCFLFFKKILKVLAILALPLTTYQKFNDWLFRHHIFLKEQSEVLYIPTTVMNQFDIRSTTVVSMHDLQQVHYPENFSWLQLKWRQANFDSTIQFASFYQASSKFQKDDMLDYYKTLSANQIKIIRDGVDVKLFNKLSNSAIDVITKYKIIE